MLHVDTYKTQRAFNFLSGQCQASQGQTPAPQQAAGALTRQGAPRYRLYRRFKGRVFAHWAQARRARLAQAQARGARLAQTQAWRAQVQARLARERARRAKARLARARARLFIRIAVAPGHSPTPFLSSTGDICRSRVL